MPRKDRQFGPVAQILQAFELVVDERSERTDVDEFETARAGSLQNRGDQRQKGGFGLSASGSGGDDDVPIVVQQRRDRSFLDVTQAAPALVPDPAADGLREPVKARRLLRA